MSAEEFGGLGFAPGVVRGVRSFNVDKFGRLTGIHYKQVWVPGENAAECRKDENDGSFSWALANVNSFQQGTLGYYGQRVMLGAEHRFEDCHCGFYGYFDGSDDYHKEGKITAVVEAYGETIIGTRGFRAKKARIAALRIRAGKDGISESVARKVTANYKTVQFFTKFDEMVAAYPPDVSLEPSPETDPEFWTRS